MKTNLLKFINIILISAAGLLFFSCNTLKQPKEIPEPINYSDSDIVENEIQRIKGFMDKEPVRALWRATLLQREDVINLCVENLDKKIQIAYDEKNHSLVSKYYKSLNTIGRSSKKYSDKEIASLLKDDVPGLTGVNKKAPKTIEDCIKATCTIWVDRGVKVENGAGYADIIIGSGFFIDERGYLVTNHHVIDSMVNPKYEGYSRLYIKLPEDMDTKIPAKVIGYDNILDLALLKVEIEPPFVFNLGSSAGLRVGDKVSAIGTPIGLEGTLTSGIISSVDRKLLTLGNVFQIDAAVNSGNSGGPLIDENMNVQAIVFAGMLQFQGLNFAIPVEYLKQELGLMYTQGKVIHPWLAAYGRTKKHGTKKVGLEVQYVMPGGSAIMSGLEAGDVIIEIDGKPINSLEDFQYLMMAYEPETMLSCKFLDKSSLDEEKLCYIYLDNRPKAPVKEVYNSDYITGSFIPIFGMKLAASSTINKNSFTISEVLPGSVADELSFSKNDNITIRDVIFDDDSETLFVQIYTQRQKKGFLDVTMGINSQYDSPFYF